MVPEGAASLAPVAEQAQEHEEHVDEVEVESESAEDGRLALFYAGATRRSPPIHA